MTYLLDPIPRALSVAGSHHLVIQPRWRWLIEDSMTEWQMPIWCAGLVLAVAPWVA